MIQAEKIIIDVNGLLSIQRHEYAKPQAQVCPFRPGHHFCGEWCPHFGSVRSTPVTDPDTGEPMNEHYTLELTCGEDVWIESHLFFQDTDHLAELRGVMEPQQGSFKNRLHREGDEP